MENKLREILHAHELKLVEFEQQIEKRNYKIIFMKEHNFPNELQFLQTEKMAITEMFIFYRDIIEQIKELLNACES